MNRRLWLQAACLALICAGSLVARRPVDGVCDSAGCSGSLAPSGVK
jgi:hypothetical protein